MVSENINIRIWRNLLNEGVNPDHILKQAADHEGGLDALPQSEDRDRAIRETVAFIKEIRDRYGLSCA